VRLRLDERYRGDGSVLSALTVPGGEGTLVKLSNVTQLGAGMSPGQIERYAQERSITIISNLYGKPLADAYREAYVAVAQQRMPPEYGIQT
jgi:multidrug efflux pump subunit AcrB